MGEKPTEMTPSPEPEQIRADIAQTRAEMAETIDAIQEKLSPQRVMEQAKETVRDATVGRIKTMMDTATDKASDLADQVQDSARQAADYARENPIPAALVGAGIAWLLMRSRSGNGRHTMRRDGWLDTVRNNPGPATAIGLGLGYLLTRRGGSERWAYASPDDRWTTSPPRASAWTEQTQRTVTDAARQTQEKVGEFAERVQENWQHYSRRAESEFDRWMRENPLTVGAAAIALGAAVGLSAPRTRTEDAWLGEARDAVVEQAQETVESTVKQAQDVVERMGDETQASGPTV